MEQRITETLQNVHNHFLLISIADKENIWGISISLSGSHAPTLYECDHALLSKDL